jgi:copper chaperone CopZ
LFSNKWISFAKKMMIFGCVFIAFGKLSNPIFAQIQKVRHVEMLVHGMVCGFCTQGIIKLFKRESDVLDVQVNLDSSQVRLVLKENSLLTEVDFKKIIENAGFELKGVKF